MCQNSYTVLKIILHDTPIPEYDEDVRDILSPQQTEKYSKTFWLDCAKTFSIRICVGTTKRLKNVFGKTLW